MKRNRRKFIKESTQYALGFGFLSMAGGLSSCAGSQNQEETGSGEDTAMGMENEADPMAGSFFNISLAQWSLHRSLRGDQKTLDNLDFAAKARNDFGIGGVEYVNQFFFDKAKDQDYLRQMNQRAEDNDVRNLLIMIDGEGNLGAVDQQERKKAVENHYKWVDAAKFLGCHSIRVNAYGEGEAEEVQKNAIESLSTLGEYAAQAGLNVLVENHGSYSSNGEWLAGVMTGVGMDNVGTLPDFGNFCVKRGGTGFYEGECVEEYDRYKGVREMMPFAKAVSAKSHEFDADGNEVNTDFFKMMQIVKDAGYTGFVGIEYEGDQLSEDEGIMATKKLLERVAQRMKNS